MIWKELISLVKVSLLTLIYDIDVKVMDLIKLKQIL